MIKTKLYNATEPTDLEESVNIFLKEEAIRRDDLIDIKYQEVAVNNPAHSSGFAKYVFMFSVLIIYQVKNPRFPAHRNEPKINDPFSTPENMQSLEGFE